MHQDDEAMASQVHQRLSTPFLKLQSYKKSELKVRFGVQCKKVLNDMEFY